MSSRNQDLDEKIEGTRLMIILREVLCLIIVPNDSLEVVAPDESVYKDQGYGEFIGFYDWLRNSEDQIIGVRFFPFEDLAFLYGLARRLDYVSIDETGKGLDIYLSNDRDVDESFSNDQAFGGNRLFSSGEGDYALTFLIPEGLARSDIGWGSDRDVDYP